MSLKKKNREGVKWIHMAHERAHTAMKFRFP